jgi:hypothetical protein
MGGYTGVTVWESGAYLDSLRTKLRQLSRSERTRTAEVYVPQERLRDARKP